MPPWATLVIGVAFIGGLVALIVWLKRREPKTPGAGGMEIGALEHRYKGQRDAKGWVSFRHEGALVRAYQQAGKDPTFTTNLDLPGSGYPERFLSPDAGVEQTPMESRYHPLITFTQEGGAQRTGKRLGINREVQIGDGPFDAAVYITASAPDELVHRVCQQIEVREAIQGLLREGYTHVEIFGTLAPVSVTCRAAPPSVRSEASHRTTLERLHTIARALPAITIAKPGKVRSDLQSKVTTMLWTLAFVSLLLNVGAVQGIDTFGNQMLTATLKMTPVVLVPLLVVLFALMRGRSESFLNQLLSGLALLVLVPCATSAALRLGNMLPDDGPGRQVEALIVERWTTTQKSSTYYHVQVEPEDASLPPSEFTVSYNSYLCLSPGTKARLWVREGALQIPWMESISCGR